MRAIALGVVFVSVCLGFLFLFVFGCFVVCLVGFFYEVNNTAVIPIVS